MEKDPFVLFIALVEFDKNIFDTKKEINSVQTETKSIQEKIDGIEGRLQTSKKKREQAQKEVDQKELDMKSYEETLSEKKDRLQSVSSQKEYAAIKKEIERIQQEQVTTEQEILSCWNKLEAAKKEFDTEKETLIAQINELKDSIDVSDKKEIDLKNKLQELENLRPEKEKDVPQEWREKYKIMHMQVKNPVAQVCDESCSVCFYNVTSQDLIDLSHNKLIQCKGCFRFLYLPKDKETPLEAQSESE